MISFVFGAVMILFAFNPDWVRSHPPACYNMADTLYRPHIVDACQEKNGNVAPYYGSRNLEVTND